MAALDRLHEALMEAKLDVVVIVGDDQKEIYHDDHMPSVLVYRGETIANVPNRTTRAMDADVGLAARTGRSARRPGTTRRARRGTIRCDAELANHLIAALIDREFDVASANACPREKARGMPSASSTSAS